MNTKTADKIIKNNRPVTVHNPIYNETATIHFVRRDRYNIYSKDGGVFDRGDLQVVDMNPEKTAIEEMNKSRSDCPLATDKDLMIMTASRMNLSFSFGLMTEDTESLMRLSLDGTK